MKFRAKYISFIAAASFVLSCQKNDVSMPGLQPYVLKVPANFTQPVPDEYNPLTVQGVALGRKLFYDTRLSESNTISCASCHHQELSFSDGVALSNIGMSGTTLHRHAPALINMAWQMNGLFWDGGSTNLESQAFGPLTAHDEMGQNLYELEDELKADPAYVKEFQTAFGDEINEAYVVKALAQFERTLISGNSRYDKYVRHEPDGTLSAAELKGMQLVEQKCAGCHTGALFTDDNYHNNGIDDNFSNDELDGLYQGRFRITREADDMGKFKTPTLRNVMLTAPYMHDGRLATIEDVLNHYSSGIKVSATTDALLATSTNGTAGFGFSAEDKANIISFLKTLTDSSFITNKSLSKPD